MLLRGNELLPRGGPDSPIGVQALEWPRRILYSRGRLLRGVPESFPSGSDKIGSPNWSTPQAGRRRFGDTLGLAMTSSRRKTLKKIISSKGIATSIVSLPEIKVL
jgi:hypothetical protein